MITITNFIISVIVQIVIVRIFVIFCNTVIVYPVVWRFRMLRSDGYKHIPHVLWGAKELPRVSRAHTSSSDSYGGYICTVFAHSSPSSSRVPES